MIEDIENEIPVNNLQYSQGSAEVRVKTIKKDDNGYIETKIERLKIHPIQSRIGCTRLLNISRPVESTICLSVEDISQATAVQNYCWRIFERILFRRVLIYGKADVINIYSREGKTFYQLTIDDGTGEITGSLNITKEAKLKGNIKISTEKFKKF